MVPAYTYSPVSVPVVGDTDAIGVALGDVSKPGSPDAEGCTVALAEGSTEASTVTVGVGESKLTVGPPAGWLGSFMPLETNCTMA